MLLLSSQKHFFRTRYIAAPHIPIVSEENKQISYDIRKVSTGALLLHLLRRR